jgi:RNA polymerase sigma factor (sigma-70 family)
MSSQPVDDDALQRELVSLLAHVRHGKKLPPFIEFSPERYSELLGKGHSSQQLIEEATIDRFLESQQNAAWERVQAVLRCRTKLQFLVFGLPSADDQVDDVVQQVMLKSHRSFSSFIGDTEREYFAWLFRILDNTMKDFATDHRRNWKIGERHVISVDDVSQTWSSCSGIGVPDPKQETPSTSGRRAESVEHLYARIAMLDKLKQEIVLRKMAEETFEAIAAQLGISKPTACRHYHAALLTLKSELQKNDC